jgi:hypothetical protein
LLGEEAKKNNPAKEHSQEKKVQQTQQNSMSAHTKSQCFCSRNDFKKPIA